METVLINTTGNHRKFYKVAVKGKTVELSWGRIGNTPMTKTVRFDYKDSAEDWAADKVDEKSTNAVTKG